MPSPKTRFGPTHTNVTRGAGGRLKYQVICRDAANNVGRGEGCCDVSLCQTEVTQIHSLGQLGTLDYHIYVLAGSLLFCYIHTDSCSPVLFLFLLRTITTLFLQHGYVRYEHE